MPILWVASSYDSRSRRRPLQGQRDVRAALGAARAVALVPAVVDRDLELVAARRDGELRGCTSCCRPPASRSVAVHVSCQSAAQPSSDCSEPTTVTVRAAAAAAGGAATIGASVPAAATSGARSPGRTRRDRTTGAPAVSEQPVGPGPLSIGWGGRRGGRDVADGVRDDDGQDPLRAARERLGRPARVRQSSAASFCKILQNPDLRAATTAVSARGGPGPRPRPARPTRRPRRPRRRPGTGRSRARTSGRG